MVDVVTIGNATLYNGDCLEAISEIAPLSVRAAITDPPYGINTKSDGSGKLSPWADMCNSAFWYAAWFGRVKSRLRTDGCMWTCLNWRSLVTFQKAACDIGWPIESLLVWDKKWIGPGGTRGLRPSYELAALFGCDDFSIDDRGLPDVQAFKWSSMKPNGHPAEKPVDLMRFLVENSTKPGETVLDPFMGSGTTGEAAMLTGRKFIGVELDRQWFDVACARIDAAQAQTDMFA
jgi:site-specific DNA-methyltransferase (adenine-specific)